MAGIMGQNVRSVAQHYDHIVATTSRIADEAGHQALDTHPGNF